MLKNTKINQNLGQFAMSANQQKSVLGGKKIPVPVAIPDNDELTGTKSKKQH